MTAGSGNLAEREEDAVDERPTATEAPRLFSGKAWFWLPVVPLVALDLWSKAFVFSWPSGRRGGQSPSALVRESSTLFRRKPRPPQQEQHTCLGPDYKKATIQKLKTMREQHPSRNIPSSCAA